MPKAAGLVHREPDPRDGRKKLMSADGSATALIDRLLAGRAAFLARAVDRVVAADGHTDVGRAIELLERLADIDLGEGSR
ncbi:hypothetical protein [Streptomyces sp. NPDC002225]|uniref:hypothetical protein n=1 Tax=Streptomyces sp. NPDC002225 TaxID=3154413 RepID=UPI0033259CCE